MGIGRKATDQRTPVSKISGSATAVIHCIVAWCTLKYKIKSSSIIAYYRVNRAIGSDVKGAVIKWDFNSRLNSFELIILRNYKQWLAMRFALQVQGRSPSLVLIGSHIYRVDWHNSGWPWVTLSVRFMHRALSLRYLSFLFDYRVVYKFYDLRSIERNVVIKYLCWKAPSTWCYCVWLCTQMSTWCLLHRPTSQTNHCLFLDSEPTALVLQQKYKPPTSALFNTTLYSQKYML